MFLELGSPVVYSFEFVLFLIEWLPQILALNILVVTMVRPSLRKVAICFMPVTVVVLVSSLVLGSYMDAKKHAYDPMQPSLREALEKYITDGEGDVTAILEGGNHAPILGRHEVAYLVKDLLLHAFLHSDTHNELNIDEGYNKGTDWFRATLGEPMVYTSGIYKDGNETLSQAQRYKLDYVAHAIELARGDKVLDIGCGWGRLAKHFADDYGAEVTGVTLSEDQRQFAIKLLGNSSAKIHLQDGMKIHERDDLPEGGFDKIVSLEMAEHVGIRRYTAFLTQVHSLLKDDGTLYFQVAGLRRHWQYEDIAWGLFMGENVFPGADASCPMGWVTTQLERAGFEVQRVSNFGTHYSRTLSQWLEEWLGAEATLTKKYGAVAYRRWRVFLAWSVRIARQGSSTVFMITATKAGQEATRISAQRRLAPSF